MFFIQNKKIQRISDHFKKLEDFSTNINEFRKEFLNQINKLYSHSTKLKNSKHFLPYNQILKN